MTLFIPDDLKKKMDAHREVRWSRAIRDLIEDKLDSFEVAQRLAQKSALTKKDVGELAAKVDAAMARKMEALLHENRR